MRASMHGAIRSCSHVAFESTAASASASAPPSPPPPSPLALSVSAAPVPDESVDDPCSGVSMEGEGLPRPLTCDLQCAGCLTLQSENARLQQAEQDALARIEMLEAELQYVRSQPLDGGPAADADTVASTEVEDSALIAEPLIASAIETPPPPARAQNWQVVVRGLPCSDTCHHSSTALCFQSVLLRSTGATG